MTIDKKKNGGALTLARGGRPDTGTAQGPAKENGA